MTVAAKRLKGDRKEQETPGTALQGMDEICGYLRRSKATVLEVYIRQLGAPITKIGGRWESDRILLEEWKRDMIREGVQL